MVVAETLLAFETRQHLGIEGIQKTGMPPDDFADLVASLTKEPDYGPMLPAEPAPLNGQVPEQQP